MASYEVEHNIPPQTTSQSSDQNPRPRRPDLSTFFTTLEYTDTTRTQNPNILPIPQNVAATFRSAVNAYMFLRENVEREVEGRDLLGELIEVLMQEAEGPPRVVKGVGDEFFETLERVPKKSLKRTDECPICSQPFLDDPYPLVVRLPCHKDHIFDLECLQPWLKLHSTCPLDRKDLLQREKEKEKAAPKSEEVEEEDGEYDDMYA